MSCVSDRVVVMTTVMGSQYPPTLPPRNATSNGVNVTHVKIGYSKSQSSRRSHSVNDTQATPSDMRRGSDPAPPPLPSRDPRGPADFPQGITRKSFETACNLITFFTWLWNEFMFCFKCCFYSFSVLHD